MRSQMYAVHVIDVRTYELEEHGFRTYEFHSRICNAFPAKTIILQSHKGLCLSFRAFERSKIYLESQLAVFGGRWGRECQVKNEIEVNEKWFLSPKGNVKNAFLRNEDLLPSYTMIC